MLKWQVRALRLCRARSIEVGKKYNMDLHVVPTFTNNQGTIITTDEKVNSRGIKWKK